MEQDLEVDSAIVQGHAAGNGPGMVIYNEGVNDLEMESENDLSNDQELQIEGDHDSDPELVNDHAVENDPGMVINNEEVNDLETGTKNDQELQIEGDHESDHELSGKELGSELDPQAAPGTLIEEEPQPVPGTLIEEPQPVLGTLIEGERHPVPDTLIEEEEEHFELVKNHSQENENTSKENHLMLENKCGEENEIYSKIILTPENYLDFSDLDFDNEDINYQLVRILEH